MTAAVSSSEPRGPSLDKDPRRIAGMFDAIAHRYDRLNRLLSLGLDRRWRRQAIDALDLPPDARVLDVCTGTADLAIAAAGHPSRPRAVLGVDFAAEMLALGHGKLAAGGLSSVTLARGDACRLPCQSASVDAVTVGFGIRNVSDTPAAIAEMFRVLKPGAVWPFWNSANPVFRCCGRSICGTSAGCCRASVGCCPNIRKPMPTYPRR